MNQQLDRIIKTVKAVKGKDTLNLSEPITVRTSPNTFPLEIHGLCVSPKDQLFIMTVDSIGNFLEPFWNPFSVEDKNADKVIDAIHQRLTSIFKKEAVA